MRPARVLRWMPSAALLLLAVVPPSSECDPSYLTMSPDGWVFPSVTVTFERDGKTRVIEQSFPSASRCRDAVALLRSVTAHLGKVAIQTVLCDPGPFEER